MKSKIIILVAACFYLFAACNDGSVSNSNRNANNLAPKETFLYSVQYVTITGQVCQIDFIEEAGWVGEEDHRTGGMFNGIKSIHFYPKFRILVANIGYLKSTSVKKIEK